MELGKEVSEEYGQRYSKIQWSDEQIEELFPKIFLDHWRRPPKQIILDFDVTDDPLHGHQQGRFFHGYYDEFCYLPLYVFCGPFVLAAKLRTADRGPPRQLRKPCGAETPGDHDSQPIPSGADHRARWLGLLP